MILTALFHEGEIADRRHDARVCQGEIIAVGPSTFLALDETRCDSIAKRRRGSTDLVIAQLREQAARMCDLATDLACKTPVERIASVLFEFRRWPLADQGGDVHIPLQRTDLADYLGLQPETVSRAFRQLEHEGLIAATAIDRIGLLDLPQLRHVANGERPRKSTGCA